MRKTSIAILVAASFSSVAFAATDTDQRGVTTSTDPDKVQAVERHLQELQANRERVGSSGTEAAQQAQPMKQRKHGKRTKQTHKPHSSTDKTPQQ